MSVVQEMFCNECIGYFRVKLNTKLNMEFKIICPNCGHAHYRSVKNGKILDVGYGRGHDRADEICPPKSAYSKEPISAKIKSYSRDGVIINKPSDIVERHPAFDNMMRERWLESYGDKA